MLERVNMTIWKGTTMEKAHRPYSSLVKRVWTRVMYQANMLQKMSIAKTLVTVISTL